MTKAIRIISVDPGPTSCGWSELLAEGPRTTCIAAGQRESTTRAILELVRERGSSWPDAFVVERPVGMAFAPYRVPPLLDTAFVAGLVAAIGEVGGARVECLPAGSVRKLLCGKANADDDDVRAVVQANVNLSPHRGPSHLFDAIAVGLVGAWIIAGRISRPVATKTAKKQPRKAATRRAKA